MTIKVYETADLRAERGKGEALVEVKNLRDNATWCLIGTQEIDDAISLLQRIKEDIEREVKEESGE